MKALMFFAWLALVVSSFTFLGLFLAKDETCTYFYSDRITFETTEEYSQFKGVVGQEGVKWRRMYALSSDPPIVVDFRVEAPYGVEIPYGEGDKNSYWPLAAWGATFVGMVLPMTANTLFGR